MKPFYLIGLVLLFFTTSLWAQTTDSQGIKMDSVTQPIDSFQLKLATDSTDSVQVISSIKTYPGLRNKILNTDSEPRSLAIEFKKRSSRDIFFYLVAGMVLVLGFLKYFYNRYFANLFRVFFNTSLRQSQLTDQLLQAKLPSLIFNFFFIISGGIYVYILLKYYQWIPNEYNLTLIISSVLLLGIVYFLKFCTLKFTGWITGLREITDTYIFVTFLINKIIGIFLVPFIVVLSFSDLQIVKVAVLLSLMSIIVFLVLRFFRSYGLLQNQLKISRFHFFLYLTGIELLPLLLIYKGLMFYLSKNL